MTRRNPTHKRRPSLVRPSPRPERPWPAQLESHYAALQPEDQPHPVDVAIDHIPKVAALRRKLIRMSTGFIGQVPNPKEFIRYEDLRLAQAVQRQEIYFDVGWAYGQMVGRAESRDAGAKASPSAKKLAKQMWFVMMTANLPAATVVAVMLELARAFVLPLRRRVRRASKLTRGRRGR